MALSIFDDKTSPPQENDLRAALGDTYPLWNRLQEQVSTRFAPVTLEWGYSSTTTGWGLRLKKQKRAILYMTPGRGYFLASFVLGGKAVQAAHDSPLPAALLAAIDAAPQYAEGRGVRLEIRTAADLRGAETLAGIKMES